MGEYGGIWEKYGEYGRVWEGTFGPKKVVGIAGNCGKNGSGEGPSEKVIKPPGEGALPTGLFYPLPDGPLFAPSCSLRRQKFRRDFCSLKVSFE